MHVQEDDVRRGSHDGRHRSGDVLALTDHLAVRPDLVPDASPEHGVVVDDHHPQWLRSGRFAHPLISTFTSVPSSGPERMVALPP